MLIDSDRLTEQYLPDGYSKVPLVVLVEAYNALVIASDKMLTLEAATGRRRPAWHLELYSALLQLRLEITKRATAGEVLSPVILPAG